MISFLKRFFYFPVASYFRFFATIRLKKWNPRIVVVTGSNGKTTLLHMLEAQIGAKAKYSHHANSSFGIPFDILGFKRKTLLKSEWIGLVLKTPLTIFKKLPEENIYVVEADCDRPGEGKFLAELLNPEVVLLTSISKTHSMNFDKLVEQKKFKDVEQAIAHEFGYFVEYCKKLVLINGISNLAISQKNRSKAVVEIVSDKELKEFKLTDNGTIFKFSDDIYAFPFLFPQEIFYTIIMCKKLANYLNISFDKKFGNFSPPPGRGSVFKGVRGITIIDSSYNANLSSMKAVLGMFEKFPSKDKWVVLGDMLEQGKSEKDEHENLANLILKYKFKKVILMGPRVCKYTYPILRDKIDTKEFLQPKEVLNYLSGNINGGEAVLFKGARFMEGIIEHLLLNKNDINKLPRREKIWEMRRKKWGLKS